MGLLKKIVVGSLAVGAAAAAYNNKTRVQKELKKTVRTAKKAAASAKKTATLAVRQGKRRATAAIRSVKKAGEDASKA